MKTKLFLFSGLLIISLTACEKENNNPGSKEVVLDVSKDLFNWIYFSFSEKDTVSVADFHNDVNWDLGIRYESFRTNGGQSGIGQGGVYDLGEVDYETVTLSLIGSADFIEDDSIHVILDMKPTWAKVPGSVPLDDMFLSPSGPYSRTYDPNNHVYIIKTANGKHVKFIGTSFFNDYAEEGYLNFKFSFLD